MDLLAVLLSNKYLSGQPATWGEGDWDGAPGGTPNDPPEGDGFFDQLDVVAALSGGKYLTGPYAAIANGGIQGDSQTSLVYDANTGELAIDAPYAEVLELVATRDTNRDRGLNRSGARRSAHRGYVPRIIAELATCLSSASQGLRKL